MQLKWGLKSVKSTGFLLAWHGGVVFIAGLGGWGYFLGTMGGGAGWMALPGWFVVALGAKWGLSYGCVLVDREGVRFCFRRIGGVVKGRERPWVWAWRIRKNGKLYRDLSRVDFWKLEDE